MALIVDIKVIPNFGKQKFILDKSGKLKCYLKSIPEKGKANLELIKLMSKKLSLSKNDIEIIQGMASRSKRLKINLNVSFDELVSKLGIEKQMMIK